MGLWGITKEKYDLRDWNNGNFKDSLIIKTKMATEIIKATTTNSKIKVKIWIKNDFSELVLWKIMYIARTTDKNIFLAIIIIQMPSMMLISFKDLIFKRLLIKGLMSTYFSTRVAIFNTKLIASGEKEIMVVRIVTAITQMGINEKTKLKEQAQAFSCKTFFLKLEKVK